MENFSQTDLDRLRISLITLGEQYAELKILEQDLGDSSTNDLSEAVKFYPFQNKTFLQAEIKRVTDLIVEILFAVQAENQLEFQDDQALVKAIIKSEQHWVDDIEAKLIRRISAVAISQGFTSGLDQMRAVAKERIFALFKEEEKVVHCFQELILPDSKRAGLTYNANAEREVLKSNIAYISTLLGDEQKVAEVFQQKGLPQNLEIILRAVIFIKKALRNPDTSLTVIVREINFLMGIGDRGINPIWGKVGLKQQNPLAVKLRELLLERLQKEIEKVEEQKSLPDQEKTLAEVQAFMMIFSSVARGDIVDNLVRVYADRDSAPKLPQEYPLYQQYMIDQLNIPFLIERIDVDPSFSLKDLCIALITLKSFYVKGKKVGLLTNKDRTVLLLRAAVVKKLKAAIEAGQLSADPQEREPCVVLFALLVEMKIWMEYRGLTDASRKRGFIKDFVERW